MYYSGVAKVCKQRQDHQKQESNRAKDKVSSTETKEGGSIEEPKCHQTMDTHEKDQSNDAVPKVNENLWSEDVDTANIVENSYELVMQNVEEGEDVLKLAVVESIVTAKLEAQCRLEEDLKLEANVSRNNIKDNPQ